MAGVSFQPRTILDNFVNQIKSGKQLSQADYNNAKAEFLKTHSTEDFDKFMTERLNGSSDKQLNLQSIARFKSLLSSPSAPTNISFVESQPSKTSEHKDFQFDGDVSFHEKNGIGVKEIDGTIKNGTVKLNLNNKAFIGSMKKLDSSLKDISYSNNNGQPSISISHAADKLWKPIDPNVKFDIKADKNGKLYVETNDWISNYGENEIVSKIQDTLSNIGIKTKAVHDVQKVQATSWLGNKYEKEVDTHRFYLEPESINVPGMTLSADGKTKGNVSIDPKNAKFSITPDGIEVKLENAKVKGIADKPSEINSGSSEETVEGKVSINANYDEKDGIKPEDAKIKVEHATSDLKLNNPKEIAGFIKYAQEQFKLNKQTADSIVSTLKNAGLAPDIISAALSADDKKIEELIQNPDFTSKIKNASMHMDIKNIDFQWNKDGVKVTGQNTEVKANASINSEQSVNQENIKRLRGDLNNPTKSAQTNKALVDSGLTQKDIDSLKKLPLTDNLKKIINPDLNRKLQVTLDKLYGHQDIATEIKSDTISAGIPEKGQIELKASNVSSKASLSSNNKEYASVKADAKDVSSTIGENKTSVNAQDVKIFANSTDANLSIAAKTLNAEIEENKKSLTAKGLTGNASGKDLKLSKEQIDKLTNLLENVKDNIADKLKNIGLTEKQFIGIAKAITNAGKQKGSLENSVAAIAKNSGATEKQIKDINALFSNQEFKSMLNDVDRITQSIKSAKDNKFNFNSSFGAQNLTLSQSDKLLAAAQQVSLKVNAFSDDGKVAVNADLSTNTAKFEKGKTLTTFNTGLLNGNARAVSGDSSIEAKGNLDGLNIRSSVIGSSVKAGVGNLNVETGTGFKGNISGKGFNFVETTKDNNGVLSFNELQGNASYLGNKASVKTDRIDITPDTATATNVSGNIGINRTKGQSSIDADIKFSSDQIKANKGTMTAKNNTGSIDADFKTPLANFSNLKANIKSDSLNVKPDGTTNIEGLTIDNVSGNAKITYGRLKKLIGNNPSGRSILKSVAAKGITIPEDQTLDFKLDKAAMKNGKLSGNISLPAFNSSIGRASVNLRVDSSDMTGSSARVRGNLRFNVDPNKFTELLYKQLGMNKDDIELKMVDGKIKAKMDGFLKSADVTVSVENNELKINVDKAKILKLFSASGIAKDKINDMIKESSLHATNSGEHSLSISLKDLTDKFIGVQGFNISNVSNEGNSFNIPFSYQR